MNLFYTLTKFRDGLYNSPLPLLASRLLEDRPVRVFSTFTMGTSQHLTIQRSWHADFPVFTGLTLLAEAIKVGKIKMNDFHSVS